MITNPEVFRAVLYDLDGTLLDTIGDIARATNAVLKKHGFAQFAPQEYKAMVGWGLAELMRRCIPDGRADDHLVDTCVAEVKAEYAAHPVELTRPYNGVVSVLGELKRRGYLQAVLSNKAHELTTVIVARALPDGVFRIVQGHTSAVPPKPHPDSAVGICAGLGLEPQQVLYVGDTAVDMETAQNAGMVSVGVTWGFRERREIEEAGARMIIDDPHELVALLPGVSEQLQEQERA